MHYDAYLRLCILHYSNLAKCVQSCDVMNTTPPQTRQCYILRHKWEERLHHQFDQCDN